MMMNSFGLGGMKPQFFYGGGEGGGGGGDIRDGSPDPTLRALILTPKKLTYDQNSDALTVEDVAVYYRNAYGVTTELNPTEYTARFEGNKTFGDTFATAGTTVITVTATNTAYISATGDLCSAAYNVSVIAAPEETTPTHRINSKFSMFTTEQVARIKAASGNFSGISVYDGTNWDNAAIGATTGATPEAGGIHGYVRITHP